jgi:hypothetical protein
MACPLQWYLNAAGLSAGTDRLSCFMFMLVSALQMIGYFRQEKVMPPDAQAKVMPTDVLHEEPGDCHYLMP